MKRLLLSTLLLAGCPPAADVPAAQGESCANAECADPFICAADLVCRVKGEPGTTAEGDACNASVECRAGLICDADGACAEPGRPGTAGVDEACEDTDDCRFGLRCADEVCVGLEAPFWTGGECPELSGGDFRALFEVPEEGEALPDFYRLPYPNDIRLLDGGRIDLTGHPSPGPLLPVVGDVVGNALRVVEQDLGGFGANQAVFFRFSDAPDLDTMEIGLPDDGGTVTIVDVTPGDGINRGPHPSIRYFASTGRGAYICENWVAVHPGDGVPLTPGHTYAAILFRDIEDKQGNRAAQDADFRAMLGATAPTAARLQDAWVDYGPLRDWLAEAELDPARVASASVYTVQDTRRDPGLLRQAVTEAPLPALSGAVLCGTDTDAYADPGDPTRGCATDSSGLFHEVQGTVNLPQFQEGQVPYKDAADGGFIEFRSTPPSPQRTTAVQVTLTVPKGVAPEGGWPVVVYAHGTEGNYASHVRNGIADVLTDIRLDDTVVRFATLGFDAPLHGPRRGLASDFDPDWLAVDPDAYDPDVLFFNPLNLRATRDNLLQEAADVWGLVRLVRALDLAPAASPTGEALALDPDQVWFVGHSQGGTVGALVLAYEPNIQGAVLSGAGGLTISAFTGKTSPYDIPQMLRVGLADPNIGRVHPVLNLGQQLFERGDGVNHARQVLRSPPEGQARKHVLQIVGVGDTYTPDTSQYALVRSLGLDQFAGAETPLRLVDEVSLPASANGPGATTAMATLYSGTTDDAHFVLFDRADAEHHMATFLGTAIRDGVPTVEPF